MNRRIRKQSSTTTTTNYLRYLRPGALAQLRDSKLKAKSQISLHRIISSSPASSPSPPSSRSTTSTTAGTVQQQEDSDIESPNFSVRFYAPRCPQRKKLMAIRSMFPEPLIEPFSNDFLVAH